MPRLFDRRLRLLAASFACAAMFMALLPAKSHAWGRRGHPIVARIAELNLKPEANTKLKALLGLNVNRSISRAEIAMWADEIKSARPHTKPWHYVDIPLGQTFESDRDCDSNCVVEKIEEFVTVLSDATAERTERQEAAKFLIHFVGDIHQPLHAAERNHDGGGNAIKVRLLGHQYKLHEVWDEVILGEDMEDKNVEEYAQALAAEITDADRTGWLTGGVTPETWANESNVLAASKVYPPVPESTNAVHNLPNSYAANNRPVVRAQIKRAGIRLAHVLNSVLAP